MDTAKGYYCVVQYCPDHSRLEAANVGVVLFCPGRNFLDARTTAGNDRVRRFFGSKSFDTERLNMAKRALEESLRRNVDGLETLEQFQHFVDTRANEMVLTAPRPVKVFEPRRDLKRLFETLVGGRSRKEARKPAFPELQKLFDELESEHRAMTDVTVKVPVMQRELKAPYAYHNGSLNLVKPEIFSNEDTRASSLAARLAIEGDLLRRYGAEDGVEKNLVVVPAFQPGAMQSGARKVVLDLFGEYKIETVTAENLPQFIERVRNEAH